MTTPRSVPTPHISEKAFLAQIVKEAQRFQWWCYHPWSSIRSQPGWPDLALAHPGRGEFLLVEAKTDKGRMRPEQTQAIDVLRASGVRVEVWRPSMATEIWAFLAPPSAKRRTA